LFLGFNGAVVFAPAGSRWLGILWTLAAVAGVIRLIRASSGPTAGDAIPNRSA